MPFGDSFLISLQADIEIFESAPRARLQAEGLTALFDSETGPRIFEAFAGDALTDVQITSRPLDVGDAAFIIEGTAESPFGPLRFAFILVVSDEVLGTLIAIGIVTEFDAADLEPLVEAMLARIRAGGAGP